MAAVAAVIAIPTANAETRITGGSRELIVEVYDTPLKEVLTVLGSSFGLQYRTGTDLNGAVSGTYKGSLREVNFFVRNSGGQVDEVVVLGRSSATTVGGSPTPRAAELLARRLDR